MSEEDLELFLKKKKASISSSNMASVFRKVYNKVVDIDPKIFFDFLGELLIEKPSYLEGNNYIQVIKKYDKFISRSYISPILLLKMEKYFIAKYCILEGEEVSLSFFGSIVSGSATLMERIYITNYRIFVIGKSIKAHIMRLSGIVYHLMEALIRKALLRSALARTKNALESKEKIYFGYMFPIMNVEAIDMKKRSLSFTSTIYDGMNNRTFKIKILFDSVYNKKERNNFLQKIVEILQNAQTDLNTSA